jgi:hypothetical protein
MIRASDAIYALAGVLLFAMAFYEFTKGMGHG